MRVASRELWRKRTFTEPSDTEDVDCAHEHTKHGGVASLVALLRGANARFSIKREAETNYARWGPSMRLRFQQP